MRGPAKGTLLSLEDVGEVVGLTKERVRQIEASALRKIRKAMLADPELREALESNGFIPAQ